jgi:hypothetical protein
MKIGHVPPATALIAGIFLLVTCVYLLTSPGRIEFRDGQIRYEVARGLVETGRPIIREPYLLGSALLGRNDLRYSSYGPGASVSAIPLMLVSRLFADPKHQLEHIAFSVTSSVYGGALAALLVAFLLSLGVSRRRAAAGGMICAFASLVWPLASSTFDNAQHAFWLLLSLLLSQRSASRGSMTTAFFAGVAGGVLFLYQEVFGFLLPGIALATLAAPGDEAGKRDGYRRFVLFACGASIGLAAWLAYNHVRFGNPFYSGKQNTEQAHHPPIWGNPLVGLAGYLLSPGKSVILYSPTVLLGLLGLRGLWRKHPRVGLAIVVVVLTHVLLMSSMTFWGGDWAWGPRYLVLVVALLSVAAPFLEVTQLRSSIRRALIATAIVVQLLALSVDHLRFFSEEGLDDFFWAYDRTFYYRRSALLARPAELVSVVFAPLPREVRVFVPSANPAIVTTAPGRFSTPQDSRRTMRYFAFFYVPRPWPFWMRTIPRPLRPFDPTLPTITLLLGAALGLAGVIRATRRGIDDA